MTTSGIGNNPNLTIGGMSMAGMDIETLLMAVQSQRVNLLDNQLNNQIAQVQQRNDNIAKLNDVLADLTKAQNQFPANAKPTDTIPGWGPDKVSSIEIPLNDAIQAAGISDMGFTARAGRITGPQDPNDSNPGKVLPAAPNIFQGGTTKAEVDSAITRIKGLIDGQSNSQQMDMLRLQSLTNKRNEAFDIMTNFVKKMSDSRSGIIGNMR